MSLQNMRIEGCDLETVETKLGLMGPRTGLLAPQAVEVLAPQVVQLPWAQRLAVGPCASFSDALKVVGRIFGDDAGKLLAPSSLALFPGGGSHGRVSRQ